jgi:tape measure domain-containing protein
MSKPVEIEILLNDRASRGLNNARANVKGLTSETAAAGKQMNQLGKEADGVQQIFKKLIGAFTMKELVSQITKTRGEVQQLQVAFETMLGSAEKSNELFAQLVKTAAITPFGLEDVANGAKQLLAYGLEAENVNETLTRLGDIAAGLSVPLNDLVYLYGTTMAQGRLYTQDLNQFTGRGIPMLSELAKQFGVAENKVKDLVESGKVGFPEVQKVIESLTDEGGKFGGLMEAQSKTITGQISNIEDALYMMFNEIGQESEGIINKTLSGISYVIENYERFGRILMGVVATYGTYRAAVMLAAAASGWETTAEALKYHWLLLVEAAQKQLNLTMMRNPYVLVATAAIGLVSVLISMKNQTELLREAEERYQDQKQKIIDKEKEHATEIENLCSVAGNEAVSTNNRRAALDALEKKYPSIFAKYKTEADALAHILEIKEKIAALDGKRSIENPKNELKQVDNRIAELEAKRKANGRNGVTAALSAAETAELKNLKAKRASLSKEVRKNEVNTYFQNLTGIDNDTLAEQIAQRENLLARMKMSGAQYGEIWTGDSKLTGVYSRQELEYQAEKLKKEQSRRKETKSSSSDWAAAAKKEYEDALTEYNKFIEDKTNKLSKEEFEEQSKKLKDALDAAKKNYDKYKPQTDKDSESAQKKADKAKREAEQREELERKLGHELVELQNSNEAESIDAMKDGLEKKLAQIRVDYQKRKEEIQKQEEEWKKDNKKAGLGNNLSEEQQSAIDTATELNEEKRRRAIAQTYQDEFALMQDTLQRYGTYQQQKLAITSEYAEKIKKATGAERQSLIAERDSKLAGISANELNVKVDWAIVFGEFGSMFSKVIKPVLADAKKYTQTDEFKNQSHDSQQAVYDAINKMEEAVGATGPAVSFGKLGQEIDAYQKSVEDLEAKQDKYKLSYDLLIKAQENYKKAQESGNAVQIQAADGILRWAESQEQSAASAVETQQQITDGFKRNVTATAQGLKAAMSNIVSGLQQLSSGNISGAYTGLIALGKGAEKLGGSLGKVSKTVVDALESVPIVGFVAEILDVLKDGLSKLVSGLLDTVFDIVSNIYKDIFSGDIFKSLGESLLTGISNIFDAISFGGFSKLVGNGDSDKDLAKDLEYLSAVNTALTKAVENLTDVMSDTATSDAKDVYEQQVELIKTSMANTQQELQRSGAAYSNGFLGIGGSHSSNKKIDDEMSSSDWSRISSIVGKTVNGAADFWTITSEQMAKVANEAPDLYAKIKNLADDGYKNSAQYMDEYIEYYKQLEELQDAYYEKLTDVSFDDVRDDFKSQLLDMTSDAEDFADNLDDIFMDALVESMMSEKYAARLKEWYQDFAKAMEKGSLSESDVDALRDEYYDIVNSALAERNALIDALEIDTSSTSQTGQSGSFTAMSQDQGTKLEGLFTSVQMHTASIDEHVENVTEKMSIATDHLRRIEENTGLSADYLSNIKEDIQKIVRDGLKTR